MGFDDEWATRPDGTVHITVVDSETTGLDPGNDEVIGIGLLCVRVDRQRGRVLNVVGSAFEWQEPRAESLAAESVARVSKARLLGARFDHAKVERLLEQTDLVVAHYATLERGFLVPHFPQLAALRWACSQADIDWQDGQQTPCPTIDGLLKAYALGPTDATPEGDCHALVRVLSEPLPHSMETGFRRLIIVSARVTVECVIPEDEQTAQGLMELGFERRGGRWLSHHADAASALALEMRVIELAVGNPAYAHLRMWRVDAFSRHGHVVGTSPAAAEGEVL